MCIGLLHLGIPAKEAVPVQNCACLSFWQTLSVLPVPLLHVHVLASGKWIELAKTIHTYEYTVYTQ